MRVLSFTILSAEGLKKDLSFSLRKRNIYPYQVLLTLEVNMANIIVKNMEALCCGHIPYQ